MTFFTTIGRQGDYCRHQHESLDEAQNCLVSHQRLQRARNKVSERQIIEVDAEEFQATGWTLEEFLDDMY